jgi:hypothetical protein
MKQTRVSEILQEQIRQQKDGLTESLRVLGDSLPMPDLLHSQLERDCCLQEQILQQKDGLEESLQLLDDSLSPDVLNSQLENDNFLAENSATPSCVIDSDRPSELLLSQLENDPFLAGNSATSSDSGVIHLDRPPNRLHLNLSRCIAFQSFQNETTDDSDDASMDFTRLHIRDLASGAERAAFAHCDSGFISCSNEEAMMNFHKEILLAEFRDLLRNHPQGGEMTVDSHKLRILLDLMHQHSSRLEGRLRACYGMNFYGAGVQEQDFDGTTSSSAAGSSDQSSMRSLYSRQGFDG